LRWVYEGTSKVDRIACPWLIRKSIDKDVQLIFAPNGQVLEVAKAEGAIPLDYPRVELFFQFREKIYFPAILSMFEVIACLDVD
jgi:hypothetical protein